MPDIDLVKRNIGRMIDQGAPEADIDAYLGSEGVSTQQLRAGPEGIAADVAKSGGIGLAKGGISLGGMAGDIRSLASSATDYLGGKLGVAPETVEKFKQSMASATPVSAALSVAPTSQDIQSRIEGVTGDFYKPKTTYGEYAQTAGEFAPAALTGPGGVARRLVTQAALPAVASETAGQYTAGTAGEPYARVAAALAAPAAGAGAARATRAIRNVDTAPSVAQLRGQSSALYKAADEADLVVSKDSLKTLADDVRTAVAEAGIDQTLHPKALAAFKRLEQGATEHQSLKGLDILRRVAGGAAQSIDRDEARIARIIRDKLDDYVENLKPGDALAGDVTKATEALTQARPLWAKMRKGEQIERLIERAGNRAGQFSGSGYENALRTEFRNLAQNEKRLARFNAQEQAAIKDVAKGSATGNALRFIGKFAPRGVVSAALSGGAGFAAGGPVGSALLMGAGELGRLGATTLTKNKARVASELVRRGGPAPRDRMIDQRRIANLLAAEAAAQQGNQPR